MQQVNKLIINRSCVLCCLCLPSFGRSVCISFRCSKTMSKVLIYLTVFVLIGQIVLAHENDLKTGEERRNEKLSVTVKIIEEDDETNGPRKTEVTVNLDVTIEEDDLKINGKFTELDVLIMYELKAEIVYAPDDIRISPVSVHVMVSRKELENGHQFLVEAHVQLIEEKKVEQFDVQVLTIHMDVNGHEFKRTTEKIKFEESNIKKTDLTRFCGQDDKIPQEVMKDPVLPDESGWGKHKKHDRGKGFCARFHKLPFAARVGILIGLVIVVLASILTCATCCCRKSKNSYQMSKIDDFKAEFEIEEDEAEPLPEKLAFDDKEVLIA